MPDRRSFLTKAIKAGIVISIPRSTIHALNRIRRSVKVGVITDLHQDIMHDGSLRLMSFLDQMKREKTQALLQMGDFAYPGDKNKQVIDMFNKAQQLRMHVIGNHDTDAGYTKDQCVQYWGMPHRYYTQMVDGVCFIILDANDQGSPIYKGGYPSYIGKEQVDWLERTLEDTQAPIVIVSHQPLAGVSAVDNASEIQQLLSKHTDKILLAVNGHTHINANFEVGGINYVHINSASYYWVGGKYMHESYPKELVKDHEWIAYTCPYKDALFSMLAIDPVRLTVTIEGSSTTWVGKSPDELGCERPVSISGDAMIAPMISDRTFRKPVS
ncbi:MAG: metallophosphoesterase family protein [bacterium]|jgi:Icc protein